MSNPVQEQGDEHIQKLIDLMDSHSLSLKDVEALLASVAVQTPKLKTNKKIIEEIQYKGVAHYFCNTCGFTFDQSFSCNRPNKEVTYDVRTCHECKYRLLDLSKEDLINIILRKK